MKKNDGGLAFPRSYSRAGKAGWSASLRRRGTKGHDPSAILRRTGAWLGLVGEPTIITTPP